MRATQSIEWTRTRLQPQEREELLAALTSEQNAQLLERDYVWIGGTGVMWNPPNGELLRRARFTHGAYFQTQRGELYIDSEGSARELSNHGIDPPAPTARPPSLPGNMHRTDDFGSSGGFDDAVARFDAG